jgi:hypothetical protein
MAAPKLASIIGIGVGVLVLLIIILLFISARKLNSYEGLEFVSYLTEKKPENMI